MINLIFTVIIILGIIYIAIIYGSTATALLGLAAALFAVLSYVYLIITLFRFRCRIEAPVAVAMPGESVNVIVNGRSGGIFAPGKIKYCIKVRSSIRKGKKKIRFRGDGIYDMSFPEAGYYNIEIKYVKIYDLTGCLCIRKRIGRSCGVMVLPEIVPIVARLTEATKNFFGDADVYDDIRPGHDPSEKFGIRPFANGDKIQSIHWKLSAKSDELMVKENSLPRACSAVILAERCARNMAEYIKIISAYSFSLMDRSCPHYVSWFSGIHNDIIRIRVDDEESYYIMINYLLEEKKVKNEAGVEKMYNEKYRSENIMHKLYLDSNMVMRHNGNVVCRYGKEKGNVTKQLENTELVL